MIIPLVAWAAGVIPGIPSPQRALLIAQSANASSNRDDASGQPRIVLAWMDNDYHGRLTHRIRGDLTGLLDAELIIDPTILRHRNHDALWKLNACRQTKPLRDKWKSDLVVSGKRSLQGIQFYLSGQECEHAPAYDEHLYTLAHNFETPKRYGKSTKLYLNTKVVLAMPTPPADSNQFYLMLRNLGALHKLLGQAIADPALNQQLTWRLSLQDLQAQINIRLGHLENDTTQYQTAYKLYSKALEQLPPVADAARDADSNKTLAIVLNNYAAVIGLLLERGARNKSQLELAHQGMEYLQQSLKQQNQAQHAMLWGTSMTNLGYMQIYIARLTRDPELLGKARESLQAASTLQRRMTLQAERSRSEIGLAMAAAQAALWDKSLELYQEALDSHQAALQLTSQSLSPFRWSLAKQSIALLLARLGKDERNADHLRKAVQHFRDALSTNSWGKTPVKWSRVQLNLASSMVLLANIVGQEERAKLLAEARQRLDQTEQRLRLSEVQDPRLTNNIQAIRDLLQKVSLR